MDEAELQQTASELALRLAAGHVRGVWEERIPLSLHTTLTLGCVTALLPAARSRPLSDGFSISDLQVDMSPLNIMIQHNSSKLLRQMSKL